MDNFLDTTDLWNCVRKEGIYVFKSGNFNQVLKVQSALFKSQLNKLGDT